MVYVLLVLREADEVEGVKAGGRIGGLIYLYVCPCNDRPCKTNMRLFNFGK